MKIYYLTTEITPFAKTAFLGDFSAKVPLALQEKGHDIRTIVPKYGFVSERKYILREVIRLREIVFTFDQNEIVVSAKSAFIPKTRVQVYFLEHPNWFKPLSNLLYKSKNGRILADNDIRYTLFCKSSLAILPQLFWSPDVIVGNDWQSAMVPIIYQQLYKEEKFFKDIKIVQIIHSLDEYANFSASAVEMSGVKIPDGISKSVVNAHVLNAAYADKVIVLDQKGKKLSSELLKIDGMKKYNDKIFPIVVDLESPNYPELSSIINEEIEKLSS
jgi:starch synthase